MLGTGIGIGIGPFGGGNSLTQRLSSLFPSGRNGALYDPSDMASLYQDVGKTTPVTVVTNPVGSVSDKSGVYGSNALTKITTAVASGNSPHGVAIDPTGKFVYVTNFGAATVSMYSINQTTGALTSIGAAVASGTNPIGVAVDPTGRFVYVTNYNPNSVSMYSINQTTGALTPIGAAVASGTGPYGISTDPLGKFVYAVNLGASTVSMYSINQTTGELTSIGAAVACGATPIGVTTDPTGKFVYVTNTGANTVSMYSINQTTGMLTSIGAAVASGVNPREIIVDSTGRFVYVPNYTDSTVSMYSINQSTGALTSIGAAVASGAIPYGISTDPMGKFVYVTNNGAATVSMYSINQTTGALTSIDAAIACGTNPRGVAVDPLGRFVYVDNYTDSTVSMYFIQRINYLTQATAAARPTWMNRVNLLTYTEQFDNAAWEKINSTITPNAIVAPDGTTTADKVIGTSTNTFHQATQSVTSIGQKSFSVYAKAAEKNWIVLYGVNAGDAGAWFDLQSGTVGTKQAANQGATIQSVGNGWYRCSITVTYFSLGSCNIGVVNADNTTSYLGDGTSGIYLWGAQVETGSTATRYQRVTAATDFDTVGFPYYLSFLGTDDSLSSTTGGGGSAGVFWCGVVQPTGGAGTLQTLFADNGTNTGYKVQKDVNNKLSFSAGNNTAFTTKVSTAALAVGTKYLLTVWDDGTNLNVQVGDAAAETVARPVVVAGTAGYTIGKENGGASSFFIGNLYPSVYFRDTAGTATDREIARDYCRLMGGM